MVRGDALPRRAARPPYACPVCRHGWWIGPARSTASAHPLVRVERPVPEPGPGQVRVRVRACGVCRTDLHLAEGDLVPRRPQVTPGHEVVGVVDRLGPGSTRWQEGDRIGVPWLAHTCGTCRFCLSGRENLCLGAALHRLGCRRRLRRRTPWWTRTTPTRSRTSSTTWRRHRSSVPGSSATGPCCGPTFPREAGSGSTASAAPPTSRPRWRWPEAPASTS